MTAMSNLSIPDGMGLKFAAWFFGRNIYRVPGADLTKELLKIEGRKYFFIWKNGKSGVEDVKRAVKGRDTLQCVSTAAKCEMDGQAIERDGQDIDWKKFSDFAPEIVFIGLGAPYQEKLIAKIKAEMGQGSDEETIAAQATGVIRSVEDHVVKQINTGILRPPGARAQNDAFFRRELKVAVGVGGTFDFLTGKVKRAPKIMRVLGLEWLYRMCQPPKPPHDYFYRVKRVLNAVFIFPIEVIKWRMRMIFCYRKGILAVIINKENKILLCERADEKDHWQFPQGGMEENETLEGALLREVCEETGLKDIKIIGKIDKKYKYRINDPRHIKNLIKAKYGFSGQTKDIFIARFFGDDNDVKLDNREFVNYQWVAIDELLDKLHPVRKEVGEMVLKTLI